jgi:hypothetical protein
VFHLELLSRSRARNNVLGGTRVCASARDRTEKEHHEWKMVSRWYPRRIGVCGSRICADLDHDRNASAADTLRGCSSNSPARLRVDAGLLGSRSRAVCLVLRPMVTSALLWSGMARPTMGTRKQWLALSRRWLGKRRIPWKRTWAWARLWAAQPIARAESCHGFRDRTCHQSSEKVRPECRAFSLSAIEALQECCRATR